VSERSAKLVLDHRANGRAPKTSSWPRCASHCLALALSSSFTFWACNWRAQLVDELVHDALHHVGAQLVKVDDLCQTVPEFGLRGVRPLSCRATEPMVPPEPISRRLMSRRTRIARHDQRHVAKIGLPTIVVRERGVIHDLQQDVEKVCGAFSISSRSSTQCGVFRIADVRSPPWS